MTGLDDVKRLQALESTGLLDTTEEEAFDRVTRLAARILKVPVSLVSLVDAHRQFFKAQVGLSAPYDQTRETPLSHSFCQHVVATDNVFAVEDATAHPLVSNNAAIRDLNVAAYLGAPLRMANGSVLGALCAIDVVPRQWAEDDVAALTDLAAIVMDQISLRSEIEQRLEAEAQKKLLIDELHHRVKNTLTVVQSLVGVSVKTAADLDDFAHTVTARLAALGSAHALLVAQNWESTTVTELARTGLSSDDRIRLDGPDVVVPSQAAISLSLSLHELLTNALKHGALSVPEGEVTVRWELLSEGDLALEWVEARGPRVAPPTRKGFGSILLERLVGDGGSLSYEPAGLRAKLTFSLN